MKISIILKKISSAKYIGVIFWLIAWQILSVVINQEILLVSPFLAIKRLIELILEFSFWMTIINSSSKIISGFLISFVVGTALAILSANYRFMKIIVKPMMDTIKTIPVVSFIILCLIWISPKFLSAFISFLMVLPVIYNSVFSGINNISKELKEVIKVFKVSKLKEIRYLYVSEVMPYLKSGSNVSLGLCWKSGIAAEVIGIPKNTIGENLYNAKIYLSSADLLAWTIMIVVISIIFKMVFMYLLNSIEKKIMYTSKNVK